MVPGPVFLLQSDVDDFTVFDLFWDVLKAFEVGFFLKKSEFGVRCVPGVVSHRVVYITDGCIQRQGFDT